MRSSAILLALLGLALLALPAHAHKDDYINETFVYRTLERGEVEAEFWTDLFSGSAPEGAGRLSYTPAVEWGVTDHLMVDSAVSFRPGIAGDNLERMRAELRYRFSEEHRHWVDTAVSFEYEWEREEGEIQRVLTPRLVLNHDFGRELNMTLNLDAGVRVTGAPTFAPAYRLGLRYPEAGRFRYGVELQETFAGPPGALAVPQVWWTPRRDITLRVGYAERLTHAGPESYLRVGVEVEF